MPFVPGDIITAQRLNRLQTATYRAVCTAVVSGAVTNADITGTEVPFTTETDNATVEATWSVDARNSGAGGGTQIATSVLLDGATTSDVFALWQGSAASERGNIFNQWIVDIPTAGAHTMKLRVTQSANNQVNVYSNLAVKVYEVV
jgi:hypothetical protein